MSMPPLIWSWANFCLGTQIFSGELYLFFEMVSSIFSIAGSRSSGCHSRTGTVSCHLLSVHWRCWIIDSLMVSSCPCILIYDPLTFGVLIRSLWHIDSEELPIVEISYWQSFQISIFMNNSIDSPVMPVVFHHRLFHCILVRFFIFLLLVWKGINILEMLN